MKIWIDAQRRSPKGAPRDLVLCGPRGNGKTVLLRWLQQELETTDETRPLAERAPAAAFTDTALQQVLDESQCHPWFLQVRGRRYGRRR